jgi:hypothetical protein
MDNAAFDELPRAYRIGLRLQALGADDELIADCLDIDPDGVVTLLDIGARKLDRLRKAAPRIDSAGAGTTLGSDPEQPGRRPGEDNTRKSTLGTG